MSQHTYRKKENAEGACPDAVWRLDARTSAGGANPVASLSWRCSVFRQTKLMWQAKLKYIYLADCTGSLVCSCHIASVWICGCGAVLCSESNRDKRDKRDRSNRDKRDESNRDKRDRSNGDKRDKRDRSNRDKRDRSNRDKSNRDKSNGDKRDKSNGDKRDKRDKSNRDKSNRDKSNRDKSNRDKSNGDKRDKSYRDKDPENRAQSVTAAWRGSYERRVKNRWCLDKAERCRERERKRKKERDEAHFIHE
ncbi:hypothetical protein WMY93_014237 [Mugilogobius chulae]|uniref:Uncharacterized protein n=1 Tax=Mugilogobius chulae TaxID=88201 RepID=A0AAW0P3W7_9GOBI